MAPSMEQCEAALFCETKKAEGYRAAERESVGETFG